MWYKKIKDKSKKIKVYNVQGVMFVCVSYVHLMCLMWFKKVKIQNVKSNVVFSTPARRRGNFR